MNRFGSVARRNGHGHRKVSQQFDAFGTLFHQRHPPRAARFMGMDSSGFARGKYTLINQVTRTKRGPARRDTEESLNSYVLDVVKVTTAEEIAAELRRMVGIEEVEAVATDLSTTLLKALTLSCPQAAHVGDHHHFARDFHKPLASIRRSYGHVIKPSMFAPVAEGRLRERVKWLIVQRWHALAPKDQEELLFYLDQCPLLEAGYRRITAKESCHDRAILPILYPHRRTRLGLGAGRDPGLRRQRPAAHR